MCRLSIHREAVDYEAGSESGSRRGRSGFVDTRCQQLQHILRQGLAVGVQHLHLGRAGAEGDLRRHQDVPRPVAGAADLLVFPSLEAANIAAKAIEYTVPVEPAHAVVGGSAPILIPSRAESTSARLNAIALGCWLVGKNR